MTFKNFGDFIQKKRVEKKITMRKMADMLECSAAFLSDVEKDRRNPLDIRRMEKLANILGLSKAEQDTMFNLAGEKRDSIAPDLPEYIKPREYVSVALRTARDLDADEADWMKFVEDLRRKSQQ
ncbi:helix-turn-helix domain-containing protein [Anaerovibrio slackiae]|uniref:helix-turn-helix domain-containing protein n=1 Tax=Anaerovibrio slackiae TaxID=2652309 RepID=UPI00386EAAB2